MKELYLDHQREQFSFFAERRPSLTTGRGAFRAERSDKHEV